MAYKQENRLIGIETPLGEDVLLLGGFHGSEGISRLFAFELEMVSENHSIPFEQIIGRNVTISIYLADHSKRYFNGIVSRFSQGRGGGEQGGDPRFWHYRATMVPWPWLLTTTADSRIFQKLSVPEIVEKIFREKRFGDYNLKLQGSYDCRDFCVQYRETDFDFVCRLLEEEGIHYFFEHDRGKHTLILADSPQANLPCPRQETAHYQLSGGGWLEEDVIISMEKMQEIRPASYTLNDYNFEIPSTDLKVNVPGKFRLGPGEREIYDYPGRYGKKGEGDRLARIRMEAEEAQITVIEGAGNCRAFTSGYRFSLSGFYRDEMNDREYLLTSVEHEAMQHWEEEAELSYSNSFTCIPYEVPYRPPRRTPKPMVRGTQTAIVVGPSGQEIYTDEHGRVKVQFHWDREGKRDENSSCWIRVSQVTAGAGWGAIDIPRIGHEVIVDFLEGDPDRPIITGRVYHGLNKPPTGLPKSGMVSGMKSNTTPGGGGFNQITMDDSKGKEKITVHGQYDMNTTVEHDQSNTVNNKFTETIKSDAGIKITEGNLTHDVAAGTAAFHVKGAVTEKYDATQVTTVMNDITITSTAGAIAVSSDSKHVYITAATSIQLHVGASMIWMDAGGQIKVKGVNIAIDGSESVNIHGGCVRSNADMEHEITGAIVKSDGATSNTVRGTMVMLNP